MAFLDNTLKVSFLAVSAVCLGIVSFQASPIFDQKPILLALLPLVLLATLLLFLQPRLALMSLLVCRPLLDPIFNMTRFNVGEQSISFGAALNLVIIFLAMYFLSCYAHRINFNRFHLAWLVFLLIMLASSFHSEYTGRALRLFVNFLSYFAMVLIPSLIIKNDKEKEYWLKFIFLSSIPTILFGNIDIFTNGFIFREDGRLQGTFSHPNMMAFYSVLMIVVGFLLLYRRAFSKLAAPWILLYIGNLITILILTQTRTAWISFLLFFLIYGIFYERKWVMAMVVILPLTFFIPSVFERIVDLTQGTKVGGDAPLNSWTWRVYLWTESWPWIKRNFLFGYGLTSFISLSPLFFKTARMGHEIGAHNVYIELLFETGIVGCLSFIAIYLTPIIQKLRAICVYEITKRETIILSAYILSYLVTCISDNMLYYLTVNWYGWFFIGILLAPSNRNVSLQVKRDE